MGTATQKSNGGGSKKMEYKKVSFNVNEIAPDAPKGEWEVSIPRGKCKVQPTREDKFPMVIVPIRLDKTEEDGEEFQKALGTELSTFLVFGGKSTSGERMAKIRIRQLCEAADVDLDLIPKELGDDPESELADFIRALEGKKFTAWTTVVPRKDTGEEVTELRFTDPDQRLSARNEDDDDGDDDADDAPESSDSRKSSKDSKGKKKASKRR